MRMNKGAILASMAVIMVASLLAGAGTMAWLSDKETSDDNKFTAGTLDLLVNGANDPDVVHFDVEDLKPGKTYADGGYRTFELKNVGSIAGRASLKFVAFSHDGNGLEEPEINAGDISDGEGEGELQDQVLFALYMENDDIEGFTSGDEQFAGGYASQIPEYVLNIDYFEGMPSPFHGQELVLDEGEVLTIGIAYYWEESAENNMAQGDSFSFDLEFGLTQEHV